jgi:hypothetical protein
MKSRSALHTDRHVNRHDGEAKFLLKYKLRILLLSCSGGLSIYSRLPYRHLSIKSWSSSYVCVCMCTVCSNLLHPLNGKVVPVTGMEAHTNSSHFLVFFVSHLNKSIGMTSYLRTIKFVFLPAFLMFCLSAHVFFDSHVFCSSIYAGPQITFNFLLCLCVLLLLKH